jgi:hypothetical protein
MVCALTLKRNLTGLTIYACALEALSLAEIAIVAGGPK